MGSSISTLSNFREIIFWFKNPCLVSHFYESSPKLVDPLYLAEILSLLLHKKQMHHSWLKLHVSGLHIPNSKISKSDVVETCLTMVLDNIAQPDLFQYQVIVNYSVKSALVRLIETFCLKKLLVGNCWQHDKQKTGKMIISQHCNIALF